MSSAPRILIWFGIGASLGSCISRHQVLESSSEQVGGAGTNSTLPGDLDPSGGRLPTGASGSPSEAGVLQEPSPLIWEDCLPALAEGEIGDPCIPESFGMQCSASIDCKLIHVHCERRLDGSGILIRKEDVEPSCFPPPPPPSCVLDEECAPGEWCEGQGCVPCKAIDMQMDICPDGWSRFDRNGCPWCVPATECFDPSACGIDGKCVPGVQCLPGCTSPECCFGNRCVEPGCEQVPMLDCYLSGCPDGLRCEVVEPVVCDCESGAFACEPQLSKNRCVRATP